MNKQDGLAARFEAQRGHLRAVAYRMLGSLSEADDAVQEVWLRLGHVDSGSIENLPAWLHTVVSRVCLDVLRTRKARREEPVAQLPEHGDPDGPEDEALLVDSVGRALLVVLDTLTPTERVAFVLHDVFAVPFDRIASIMDRSLVAAKKLASRARQRVRGTPDIPAAELARQRHVVEAFLAASRRGDLDALLAVLAPDVVRRADAAVRPAGVRAELRGARAVAEETVILGRRARFAALALVDGVVGVVVAPRGRLQLALIVTIKDELIAAYDVIADPGRLRQLELAVLAD